MIRGIEAVVLEEASPCSVSGSMVVGTGGYLTENLEMSADCRRLPSRMRGPKELTSSTDAACRLSSLVAMVAWIRHRCRTALEAEK